VTRRKIRLIDTLGTELEKYKDDLAKQQAMLNDSFTCENNCNQQLRALQKALDKAKQVCVPIIFSAMR